MSIRGILTGVLLLLVLLVAAQLRSQTSTPVKWEYLALSSTALRGSTDSDVSDRFTDHGKQGWELVTAVSRDMVVFKRPVR